MVVAVGVECPGAVCVECEARNGFTNQRKTQRVADVSISHLYHVHHVARGDGVLQQAERILLVNKDRRVVGADDLHSQFGCGAIL